MPAEKHNLKKKILQWVHCEIIKNFIWMEKSRNLQKVKKSSKKMLKEINYKKIKNRSYQFNTSAGIIFAV